MLKLLADLKRTVCIAEGWKLGRLIVEDCGKAFIELEDGRTIPMKDEYKAEVETDNGWIKLSTGDLRRKTEEGWPLFAGLEVRFLLF